MTQLCFNTMNHSAFFSPGKDPDLPGQAAGAAAAGFQLFGPDGFSIGDYCERGGSAAALAATLEQHGLRCFELPALMINADAEQTRAAVETMAGHAAALRPDYIQVNVESPVDAEVLALFREAAGVFDGLGAGLAVEYLPWLPVHDIRTTRDLLQRAGVDSAGIIVDTWHFFYGQDDWPDLESLPLAEIAYIQFDDHPELASDDLLEETIQRRVMPGDGVFELERFCGVVRAKGFDGVVSCEILSEETRQMDPAEFARRVYQSSIRFWS